MQNEETREFLMDCLNKAKEQIIIDFFAKTSSPIASEILELLERRNNKHKDSSDCEKVIIWNNHNVISYYFIWHINTFFGYTKESFYNYFFRITNPK